MECGGVPCAISGSSRHGKGKETPFGRVRAPRGEAPVATQGDPLANAWVIRCGPSMNARATRYGPSMNARTTRYGPSPCFRMESMRKRFACLKGNERKAESTQFRSPSQSRPRPPRAPAASCRSAAPVAAPVAACRHHPVIHFPLLLHRQHSDLPPPHARSHHPCVQFRMQFRCCTSCRYHPDMQPFRCNIVGITRPECTESPPISCIQAG